MFFIHILCHQFMSTKSNWIHWTIKQAHSGCSVKITQPKSNQEAMPPSSMHHPIFLHWLFPPNPICMVASQKTYFFNKHFVCRLTSKPHATVKAIALLMWSIRKIKGEKSRDLIYRVLLNYTAATGHPVAREGRTGDWVQGSLSRPWTGERGSPLNHVLTPPPIHPDTR